MNGRNARTWLIMAMLGAGNLLAQNRPPSGGVPLSTLSSNVEQLVRTVGASVVQVLVTSYGPLQGTNGDAGVVVGQQHAIGSGVVLSNDGYIITNAHVVRSARQVSVRLSPPPTDDELAQFLSGNMGQTLDARIVGVAQDLDLALLKINAKGLRPLAIADYHKLRQGELVFAFGSPEGFRNSVTMGVVSAPARQPDPDSPTIYIQTDAAINPGNSGGALVNVAGELVALNTFIISQSGGSEGLGFAIPSGVVASAYADLRSYGVVRRGYAGLSVQSNTPELAAGLHLARSSGVLVSDVIPGTPADDAGIKPRDIVLGIDGIPINTVAMFGLELASHKPGDDLRFQILRDSATATTRVHLSEEPGLGRFANGSPDLTSIAALGVVGVSVTDRAGRVLAGLRIPSGFLVAARMLETALAEENPLTTGDVIHAINDAVVGDATDLQQILSRLPAHSAVVLQLEREGQLRFVTMRLP